MKRSPVVLVAVLTAVVTPFTLTAAQGAVPGAEVATATKIQLHKSSLGKILVDSSGFTLYMFTKDGHNKDTCMKISGCASTWPAVTTSGKPKAGPGVSASKLSTITISRGRKQVTYAGHPLYRYMFEAGPNDTTYVGQVEFGGTWEAINAAGKGVK